jgi:hypothetical protein
MIPIVIVSETPKLDPRVEAAMIALEQPIVHFWEERKAYHCEREKNRCVNIAKARTAGLAEAVRRYKKATHFLFLDSDIIPPADILERFGEWSNEDMLLGAWWKTRFGNKYVGGHWYGGVVKLFNVIHRRSRLTETHLISLGCSLVPRRYLVNSAGDLHVFDPGIDTFVQNREGKVFHIADSGAFSLHVKNLRGRMYLDSRVIAEHLSEGKPIVY